MDRPGSPSGPPTLSSVLSMRLRQYQLLNKDQMGVLVLMKSTIRGGGLNQIMKSYCDAVKGGIQLSWLKEL